MRGSAKSSVMRSSVSCLAAAIVLGIGPAPRASQDAAYRSGATMIDAHHARPLIASETRAPAVIVVHDDQGLTDTVREIADLFAAEGFVALAPDLVSRLEPQTRPAQNARGPVATLSLDQSVQDVAAAFAFLQADPSVDPGRISVVGFGWGGWRAFSLAELTPTLHRAVVFYGTTSDDRQLDKIRAPVLGHYAEYDFQTTAQVLATKRRMGDRFTYYIYPDMDRGFFGGSSGAIDYVALIRGREAEPTRPPTGASSNLAADAVRLSWQRTIDFLR